MNTAPTEAVQTNLNDKKVELESMREQKIEGLLLRSRANWHENGEKCSQYFLKLEKRNFIKKTMVEMIGDPGTLGTNTRRLLLFERGCADLFEEGDRTFVIEEEGGLLVYLRRMTDLFEEGYGLLLFEEDDGLLLFEEDTVVCEENHWPSSENNKSNFIH
ncbi:Hypothetical predicted protein [Mytilus galloprovincialis]|uniref:Uncharacterized protein n=1 Tax=Mytilus galloprovincialis TaxID=29158 RepID=A0A8B6CD30_MYTGA|nr:Hypothetical predicted protein [Mytilus galloprovincialis]